MESEPQEARGLRLHGLSPAFQIGSSFLTLVVPGLLFLVFASGDSYSAWFMLAFVPAVSISLVRYFTLRYDLTAEHVVVREGLVFKSIRHIPFSRIQNIDTTQNPLHRLFGVAEVRLETAGGREPEAVFRVLSLDSLEVIRKGVFAGRNGLAGALDPVQVGSAQRQTPFFRMGWLNIALFGLLSQKGLALLAGLVFLMWEFELWSKIQQALPFDPEEASKSVTVGGWIFSGLGLVLLLQVLTLAWSFLTLHGFRILRTEEGLSTYCGLWIKQSATLPRHRIHFLSIREGLLSRWLGRLSIQAATAGGDLNAEEQISRKWLIPLTHKTQLDAILREVQPELELSHVDWTRVHPRALGRMLRRWWVLSLAPCIVLGLQLPLAGVISYAVIGLLGSWGMAIRAKHLGYALGKSAILVRDGILTRERNAVRYSKIQSISVRQNPFDRRARMATLEVDTAGQSSSGLRLRIPYLGLEVAESLKDELRQRAAAAAFHW